MLKDSSVDLYTFEALAREAGHVMVAGIDEAGRGPLAGPVVAAAVVLPPDFRLDGVNDSKQLTPRSRDKLFQEISDHPQIKVGVSIVSNFEIDQLNILKASHHAMRQAIKDLTVQPDFLLIDGLPVPNMPIACQSIVKGDSKSASIAAASIVAKVTRDKLMVEFDCHFPGYGFARHKGYATKQHLAALEKLGPCEIHRRTFAPVTCLLQPTEQPTLL